MGLDGTPEDCTDRANEELRNRGVIRLFSDGPGETR